MHPTNKFLFNLATPLEVEGGQEATMTLGYTPADFLRMGLKLSLVDRGTYLVRFCFSFSFPFPFVSCNMTVR